MTTLIYGLAKVLYLKKEQGHLSVSIWALKQIIYKGKQIRLVSNFSTAVFHARRQLSNIYKILKERVTQEYCA